VQGAPAVVTDDEETIERAEGDRWNRKETHRPNGFSVVARNASQRLAGVRIPRRSFHVAEDRSLRDIKTKHEELVMCPGRAPGWILNNHQEDQLPNLV
jgi:hypothetical protein